MTSLVLMIVFHKVHIIVSSLQQTLNNLSQITKLDEGWYRCGTSNLYGSETRDAYLTVIDPCKGVECGGRDEKCVVNYDTLSAECQCRDYCQVLVLL